MLLTMAQMKHLEPDGNEKFKYVDNGNATAEEKQELRDLDEDFFAVYQYHIITNIKEII